jgi:fibronectin-binding autotransporter adhesin
MKPKFRHIRSLAIASSVILCISSAQAQSTLYWDGGTVDIGTNGNGVSGGTAGNWNTTLLNWDGGVSSHLAWNNSNLDTAFFGGTAGTVTLTAPIAVGGLSFLSSTGYTLAAGTQGLTFGAADNAIRLVNSSNGTTSAATISGTVGGTGNVTLTSINPVVTSTLTFNGTSTGGWSGSTTLNQNATMALAASSQALLNTSAITLNGGNITLTNTSAGEALLNRVANSASITSRGGNFTFTNTAASGRVYAETIGSVDLVGGQTNFLEATNQGGGGGNSQTLTLSGLTRTGATNTSAVSFGAASGLNTTTNIINVTGASGTGSGSGQIIGAWAFYGTTPASPTDYAVYDASGNVLNASISATAEDSGSWVGGANVTLNAATTLTATRSVNTLRYSGAAGSLNLGASDFNLETYGLLNGGSGLTISTTGTGALTTPTGGGKLFITPGAAAITVSAPIKDNSGAVTLVKSGSNTLTLSNTGNSYSGGTVLNGGTLAIGNVGHIGGASANLTFGGNATLSVSAALNFSGGTLTVNQGANAIITKTANSVTTFATTTGSGNLVYEASGSARSLNMGNASGFTGNLTVRLAGNANYNTGTTIQFSSLGDGVGSALQFVGGTSDSNQALTVVLAGGSAPVVFNNRQIQALPRLASNQSPRYMGLSNNNASATNTWTINTDLFWAFTTNGATNNRELRFGGSNTGDNAFNGLLSQGQSTEPLNLSKIGAGKWILGNTANTYTGFTDVRAGTLEVKSLANGGLASSIGTSSNAASNLLLANGTSLRYTGTGHSSDRNFTLNVGTAGHGATLDASGTGALNLTNTATPGYGTTAQTRTLTLGGTNTNSNTLAASLTNNGGSNVSLTKSGAGTWKLTGTNSYSGATAVNGGMLVFGNTSAKSGSAVSATAAGSIGLGVGGAGFYSSADVDSLFANTLAGFSMNAASGVGIDTSAGDFTHASNQDGSRALTKLGANALILTGDNTYTGATTVVEGSLLVNGSTGGSSTVSVSSGATLGGTGTINGAVNVSGVLSPGASIETLGSGTLSFANGSSLLHELDSSVATSVGSDLLKVTGDLNLTGTVGLTLSDLALTDVAFNVDDVFSVINYTGTWNTGLFTFEGNQLAEAEEFTFGLNTWRINYAAATGGQNFTGEYAGGSDSFVNLTVVPEPSSVALLGTLGAMMLLRRRR